MKMVECIKCGEPKLESEFYKGKRNTCKECHKVYTKERWAKKRRAKRKREFGEIKKYILGNYEEANVEIDGIGVVENGEFIGKCGRALLGLLILKHRDWMKKNKLSEPDMVPTDDR